MLAMVFAETCYLAPGLEVPIALVVAGVSPAVRCMNPGAG